MNTFNINAWCQLFNNALVDPREAMSRQQLSDLQTQVLMNLLFASPEHQAIMYEDVSSTFECRIINSRLGAFNVEVEPSAKVFLMFVANSPGNVVMWATYLQWWAKQHNMQKITLTDITTRIMPHGGPTDKMMSELWNHQKGFTYGASVDNYLDTEVVKELN